MVCEGIQRPGPVFVDDERHWGCGFDVVGDVWKKSWKWADTGRDVKRVWLTRIQFRGAQRARATSNWYLHQVQHHRLHLPTSTSGTTLERNFSLSCAVHFEHTKMTSQTRLAKPGNLGRVFASEMNLTCDLERASQNPIQSETLSLPDQVLCLRQRAAALPNTPVTGRGLAMSLCAVTRRLGETPLA
jgi:hypothetical protein